MNRRELITALAGLPVAAMSIDALNPAPHKIEIVDMSCSCLNPQAFRSARDIFGEDCVVTGHPAQRNAWQMARQLFGNPAYSHEWNEKSCNYFFGECFNVDRKMPKDVVEFSRYGQVVGVIRNLAVPVHG